MISLIVFVLARRGRLVSRARAMCWYTYFIVILLSVLLLIFIYCVPFIIILFIYLICQLYFRLGAPTGLRASLALFSRAGS